MTPLKTFIALLGAAFALTLAPHATAAASASLQVEGERFVLTLPDGKTLTSPDLVGAELQTQDGHTLRIDAMTPAKERASLLLHSFSVLNEITHAWEPACDADAYGRKAGFPVEGAWTADGHFLKTPGKWFLACTGGSRGKCIVWGYDPWGKGPHGEDLADFYRACQFTARANYDGQGDAHTKNGTEIDVADVLGIETHDSLKDSKYTFEAGWSPTGAVCVATSRWPDLLTYDALIRATPRLGGPCTEEIAKRKGALIFTRVIKR